jgi:hypothetical protein
MTDNPMRSPDASTVSQASRCGAKTRSGASCKSTARVCLPMKQAISPLPAAPI